MCVRANINKHGEVTFFYKRIAFSTTLKREVNFDNIFFYFFLFQVPVTKVKMFDPDLVNRALI